ncbi:MAG: polyprenyl synthetase family protein [Clostridia bacterium]|nr:polyprenyl synthetase family protein [Clostridia bacterium]
MDNLQRLKETAAVVEKCLDKYLPLRDTYEKTIYEAMRYSALGGGKRIRGVLTLMSCMMAGGKAEDAYPFAAAIEMIHAYSLIHDDLPAMDNDDFRRGKPTNHKKYGEAMAILAGDGLLGLAFETVLKNAVAGDKTWDALKLMSICAGPDGMLGGQVVDMEAENKEIGYDELVYLQQHKTGALIKASCLMGAVIGGADEELKNKLELYAKNIGLAFQIKDDILDVEGDGDVLGKPIGSDAESGKSTFVTACGIKKSKEMVKTLSEEAAAAVLGINEYGDFLAWLALWLAERNH